MPIEGTLAATYLREHRGLELPLPPTLRFRKVKFPGKNAKLPAMLAVVSGHDRKPISTQVTFLVPSTAAKIDRRTYGALADGAVRLAAAGDTLALAEGVETGLAYMQKFGVPTWCTLGVERFLRVAIPPTVKHLIFAADNGVGYEKALHAAHRLSGLSSPFETVRVHAPKNDAPDWNDVVLASYRAMARRAAS